MTDAIVAAKILRASRGIPIVLLPGLDGTGDLLAPLAARLSATRPVEVIHYPVDKQLGYEALTALVTERLPPGKFIILGESFSGPIAIEIAARERARTAGLILAASFARTPVPRLLAPFAGRVSVGMIPTTLVALMLLGKSARPELKAAFGVVLAKVLDGVIRGRMREVAQVDVQARLAETQAPILYLRATRDLLVGRKSLAEIQAVRPDCEVRRLAAPHMLLETRVSDAAEAIGRFCADLPE